MFLLSSDVSEVVSILGGCQHTRQTTEPTMIAACNRQAGYVCACAHLCQSLFVSGTSVCTTWTSPAIRPHPCVRRWRPDIATTPRSVLCVRIARGRVWSIITFGPSLLLQSQVCARIRIFAHKPAACVHFFRALRTLVLLWNMADPLRCLSSLQQYV